MRLAEDWRVVLAHAWSIRLIALAVVLSLVEGAVSLAGEIYDLPFWLHAVIVIAAPLVAFAAGIARLIAQEIFDGAGK